MNYAAFVWLVLMVLFLAAEASTVSLVSLWFAFGALGALIVGLLGGSVFWQMTVFLVVSTLLLLLLRPLVRRYFTPRLSRTNVDSIIGSQGYVTERIDNADAVGQVKLGAMYWTARSTSGTPIAENTLVRVDRIEGVKVFVSPVNSQQAPNNNHTF